MPLLPIEAPPPAPPVHVVVVSALLVAWLEALLVLPLLALAFVARRELAAAAQAYLARLRARSEAPPAG